MTRTTTVTHPDGTTSKRTSKSRTYSHAIEVGPVDPATVAARFEEFAVEADAKAAKVEEALRFPDVVLRSRGFQRAQRGVDEGYDGKPVFHNFVAALKGTDGEIYTWANSRGVVQHGYPEVVEEPALTYLVRSAEGQAARHREAAEGYRTKAAALRSGDLSPLTVSDRSWGIVRWSSSRTLATKALGSFDHFRASGCVVRVVECQEA